jgi:hypothetical protein
MPYLFCNLCAHRNPPGSVFCSLCGSPLDHTDEHTANIPRVPGADPADATGEIALDRTPEVSAVLMVRGGEQDGLRFALSDTRTTLGRYVDNDISLDDITVSRHQALLEKTPAGYLLSDQRSRNGTYVNGELISQKLLEHGDEIQVGKFHFLFLIGSE